MWFADQQVSNTWTPNLGPHVLTRIVFFVFRSTSLPTHSKLNFTRVKQGSHSLLPQSAKHWSFGMDMLVVVGTSVSYLYSSLALLLACSLPGDQGDHRPHLFLESPAMLLTFIALGRSAHGEKLFSLFASPRRIFSFSCSFCFAARRESVSLFLCFAARRRPVC